MCRSSHVSRRCVRAIRLCDMMEEFRPSGPVAQLGARFHGMEEVKGSNPFRSTKVFKHIQPSPSEFPFSRSPTGVQFSSSRTPNSRARLCTRNC
jgi:hypothetical protein